MWGAINRDLWEIIICDTKKLSLTSIIKIPYRQERRIKKKLNIFDFSYDCKKRKHDLPNYIRHKNRWDKRFKNLAYILSHDRVKMETIDKGTYIIFPTGYCKHKSNSIIDTNLCRNAIIIFFTVICNLLIKFITNKIYYE